MVAPKSKADGILARSFIRLRILFDGKKRLALVVVPLLVVALVAFSSQSHDVATATKQHSDDAGINKEAGTKGLRSAGDSASSGVCPNAGSFAPKSEIIISKAAVRSYPKTNLDRLKGLTEVNHEKWLMAPPGREHYTLLEFLTKMFADCRHVVDIGTRYVTSALALGANGVHAETFDTPTSTERTAAFRGKTEEEWQKEAKAAGVSITFHNVDLLTIPLDDFRKRMGTWLIVLDTHHRPYTRPFEREFLTRLREIDFKGVLFLDDIHEHDEMKRWWKELQTNEAQGDWNFRCFEVTDIGHWSGSGIVDWSGKVSIVE